MPKTKKEIKEKYFKKVYDSAIIIECACGCGRKLKNKDKYGRDKKFINGHNNRKYDDPTQYKREWNHRNRKKRYLYHKEYSQNRKNKLIGLFGNKCKHCGLVLNDINSCCFEFHHIDNKSFSLSLNGLKNNSWENILKESRKCILLCSNCHRILHHLEHSQNL